MGLPPEYGESFDQGAYRMDRSAAERSETLLPLETGEPRVCKWDPDLATGKAEPTEHGLAVFNIQSPAFEKVGRRPGDLWIDLPLVANQRPIGKLTIDCGTNRTSDLKPEDLELLGLFSASLGALLDALDRKERWVRDAADKAMATCAHNIRTKLAALDGFADRYQRAAPRNAKVRELNQLHQPAVDGCFRQVTRIKETFAGIQLERTPTRLKPLLEATVDGVYGKDQRARRVTWVVHCPEDLMFSLDADRIRNAVEEMLHNSREMVPPNRKLEVELRVELQQRGPRQWLRLALYDTGPGVPPDKRELIFEPFYSDRPYGKRSTGLGLNLVRRVVEAHGGKVWVTGESGHGAEFVIEIPDEGGQT
jgi:signal transduction histidine kinase